MVLRGRTQTSEVSVLTETGSLWTEAVRPAALEPFPEVYTAMGATFSTNLRSCDFAVPGSPRSSTLMSPRSRIPSGRIFLDPPNNRQAIAFFISMRIDQALVPSVQPCDNSDTYQDYRRY